VAQVTDNLDFLNKSYTEINDKKFFYIKTGSVVFLLSIRIDCVLIRLFSTYILHSFSGRLFAKRVQSFKRIQSMESSQSGSPACNRVQSAVKVQFFRKSRPPWSPVSMYVCTV
jgi:hypothetical protein